MLKPKELAVLFKKIVHQDEEIEFIPIKVIEGIYNEKNNCFIDKDGTPYFHIIENPDSYGYCYRDSIINYKSNYKHLSVSLIKALLLRTTKKYTFTHNIDKETEAPLILFENKDEKSILLDEEIAVLYEENFPEFYNKYLNEDETKEDTEENKEELDIKKIYKKITSIIIDQDEAIKKLISIIWKQNLNFKSINKNILIDGPSGVGKSKICKLLVELIGIPSVTISTSEGKIRSAEHTILELVQKAHGNVEKAQKGIIILDKFEDFIMYSSPEGKGELEKLFAEDELIIPTQAGEFLFNTKNLIVICISNLDKIKRVDKKITGFYEKESKNSTKKILEYFDTSIKLNELNFESYIKILNSPQGLLNQNIELLNSQGVNLVVTDKTKEKIANLADADEYKVKSLECIIDRTLEIAEFEIASNPNMYSELIITPETIEDNKKYILKK